MASQANIACKQCGVDLATVGVKASIRETVLCMGGFGRGLRRVASEGPREVYSVRCAQCGGLQPASVAEELHAA